MVKIPQNKLPNSMSHSCVWLPWGVEFYYFDKRFGCFTVKICFFTISRPPGVYIKSEKMFSSFFRCLLTEQFIKWWVYALWIGPHWQIANIWPTFSPFVFSTPLYPRDDYKYFRFHTVYHLMLKYHKILNSTCGFMNVFLAQRSKINDIMQIIYFPIFSNNFWPF